MTKLRCSVEKRLLPVAIWAILCSSASPFSAVGFAQTSSGSILGYVFDVSGASVPGARVSITDEKRNISTSLTTDGAGGFVFPTVALGVYTLSVEAPNFRTYLQEHIEVNVGQSIRVNVTLQVGDVTQKLVVEAAAPLLETATSSIGQVVNGQMIMDLPLNGRDFTQLALLSGNATHTVGGFAQNAKLSFDGGRTSKTEFVLVFRFSGKWRANARRMCRVLPLRGGDFQGMRKSIESDV